MQAELTLLNINDDLMGCRGDGEERHEVICGVNRVIACDAR